MTIIAWTEMAGGIVFLSLRSLKSQYLLGSGVLAVMLYGLRHMR